MYFSLLYGRCTTGWSKPNSTASPLIRSEWPLLSPTWLTDSGVHLSNIDQVSRIRCVSAHVSTHWFLVLSLCELLLLQSNGIVVVGNLRAEQAKPCKSQVPPGHRILLLCCPATSICKWRMCYSFCIQYTRYLCFNMKNMCNFNRRTRARTHNRTKKCSMKNMIDLMMTLM